MQETQPLHKFDVAVDDKLATLWANYCLDTRRDPGSVLRVALRQYLHNRNEVMNEQV